MPLIYAAKRVHYIYQGHSIWYSGYFLHFAGHLPLQTFFRCLGQAFFGVIVFAVLVVLVTKAQDFPLPPGQLMAGIARGAVTPIANISVKRILVILCIFYSFHSEKVLSPL